MSVNRSPYVLRSSKVSTQNSEGNPVADPNEVGASIRVDDNASSRMVRSFPEDSVSPLSEEQFKIVQSAQAELELLLLEPVRDKDRILEKIQSCKSAILHCKIVFYDCRAHMPQGVAKFYSAKCLNIINRCELVIDSALNYFCTESATNKMSCNLLVEPQLDTLSLAGSAISRASMRSGISSSARERAAEEKAKRRAEKETEKEKAEIEEKKRKLEEEIKALDGKTKDLELTYRDEEFEKVEQMVEHNMNENYNVGRLTTDNIIESKPIIDKVETWKHLNHRYDQILKDEQTNPLYSMSQEMTKGEGCKFERDAMLKKDNEIFTECKTLLDQYPSPNIPNKRNCRENNYGAETGFYVPSVVDTLTKIGSGIESLQRRSVLPSGEPPIFDGSDLDGYVQFRLSFTHLVEENCSSYAQLYNYLLNYTKGTARNIVNSCFQSNMGEAYKSSLGQLDLKYGNKYLLARQYIDKLHSWPSVKGEDKDALEELSLFLTRIRNMMLRGSEWDQLNSPSELKLIIDKLPIHMAYGWRDLAFKMYKIGKRVVFNDLVNFVLDQYEKITLPIHGDVQKINSKIPKTSFVHSDKSLKSKSAFVSQVEEIQEVESISDGQSMFAESASQTIACDQFVDGGRTEKNICIYCQQSAHSISSCETFAALPFDERYKLVKDQRLCFRCLKFGHSSRECFDNVKCSECGSNKHGKVMHRENSGNSVQGTDNRRVALSSRINNKVISPSVPVQIRFNGGPWVSTYAALDAWASDNFISETLSDQLSAQGCKQSINLVTMNSGQDTCNTKSINGLEISDINKKCIYKLCSTHEITDWPFAKEDAPNFYNISKYEYLKRIPFKTINSGIGILLGQCESHLMKVMETVGREENEPYATRYALGWALNGPITYPKNNLIVCHRVCKLDLEKGLEDMYRQEFNDPHSGEVGMSFEDKLWHTKVEKSMRMLSTGNLEIGLPFRDEEVNMPDNRAQAEASMYRLRKRFKQNLELKVDYCEFMNKLIANDHLKLVSPELEHSQGKIWFLVHHPVYHKIKKKIRIVFDCSRRSSGVSLNDKLLSGPDLLNSLVGVLLRFREEAISFACDIEQMFMQVKVPMEHSNFMRVLWWPGGDINSKPVQYRLTSHTFGAISSPSVANYAVKQAAFVAKDVSEEAYHTLNKCIYMDDVLRSLPTTSDAIKVLKEVRAAAAKVGFNLTAINSNSREVLLEFPKEFLAKGYKEFNFGDNCALPDDRVLGVFFNIENDCFSLKLNIRGEIRTRRAMLSVISGIFDPLGLVSPVLVPARSLFQQTCNVGLGWDEQLPPDIDRRWGIWLHSIDSLSKVNIPRCLKRSFSDYNSSEVHIFCDGSKTAYAAVAYSRFVNVEGNVRCTLIMSKTRQVPIRGGALSTVPRIELNAAKLAITLSLVLRRELDQQYDSYWFWTDSSTVLSYIRSLTGRFQRFVENRVHFITENSARDSWKFVPGKLNIADVASRGQCVETFLTNETWVNGPSFLHEANIRSFEEPLEENIQLEIKESKVHSVKVSECSSNAMNKLLMSTGDWCKILLRICCFMSLVEYLQGRLVNRIPFTVNHLKHAETVVWRFVQWSFFPDQIDKLRNKQSINRNDKLYKLSPEIDENSLLRAKGRLDRCHYGSVINYPIILPGKSSVVEAYIRHVHRNNGHFGRGFLISTVQEKFHIIGIGNLVKKILKSCVWCSRLNSRPEQPTMADLPEARVNAVPSPFYETGIDYFGPFDVTQGRGRRHGKRYGIVFTCLTSRAIHLEVADTLDTDSFLLALRRFIARRGSSDNGTNLVGAWRIIREKLSSLDQSNITSFTSRNGIDWKFSPPKGSNFGGIWEREIRTVRKTLYSLIHEKGNRLRDEDFRTFLCEIENILNSRPLCPVIAESFEIGPITPNHLLRCNVDSDTTLRTLDLSDVSYYRNRYKYVQSLVEEFWRRWKKEYIPTLRNRSKWVGKSRNIVVGDMVVVVDGNAARNTWPTAIVTKVFPSADGVVRRVEIRLARRSGDGSNSQFSILVRPVNKLIVVLRYNDE